MKIVLITGATSGIGFETAKMFDAQKDTKVISLSRSKSKIQKAKKQLKNTDFFECDVSDYQSVENVCNKIEKKYKKIDILINNAGNTKAGNLQTLKNDDWDNILKNNLSSYFYVTKIFLNLLKNGNNASVINISSISGIQGGSSIAYACAKAGVNMFSQILSLELAKYKIRVNTISPGLVDTGFNVTNKVMTQEKYEKVICEQQNIYPFGVGNPKDIANAILFLTSQEASWITGTNLIVDGGRLSVR